MRGNARIIGLGLSCALVLGCGRWGFDGSEPGSDDDTAITDPGIGPSAGEPDGAVAPSVPRQWGTAATAMTPGQALAPKLVYYPPRQTVLMYGGTEIINDVPTPSAAMWEYDGSDWAMVCDPCPPGPRVGHEMVYDVSLQLMLVIGGDNGLGGSGEVWDYDGSRWREFGATNGPATLINFEASYDVSRQVTVVMTAENQVYELSGSGWSTPLDTVPGGRSDQGSSATYDAERGGVVVYGGRDTNGADLDDAWLWDGTRWSSVCNDCTGQPRRGASVVYDPLLRETFVVGGESSSELGGTWLLGEPLAVDSEPAARTTAGVSYDTNRDVLVIFGGRGPGCNGNAFNACDDTLEMALTP